MKNRLAIYNEILFSFLDRDNEYPAVKKSKGYSIKGALKTILDSWKSDLIDYFSGDNNVLKNKIWLYAESINQLRSIEFLNDLENTVIVTNSDKLIRTFPGKRIYRIVHKNRLKIRFSWLGRRRYYKDQFKNRFKEHFNSIYRYEGVFESLLDIFKIAKPKAIIMANDHNAMCRALLFAGKEVAIPTIYLQHAAVTDRFPPLSFDLNLLDGEDSLKKYLKVGPIKGKVELVGMPKFDQYFNRINKNKKVSVIGVALNNGDDFADYYRVCDLIRNKFEDIQFIFRYHPSINTDELSIPNYIKLSKPGEESSFDFLAKTDLLFSGNSSIHLEATIMNVLSVYVNFNHEENDYYGFIAKNLVSSIPVQNILTWLSLVKNDKPDVRHRAKYFVDTIDTKWDGKSGMMVNEIINKYCLHEQ